MDKEVLIVGAGKIGRGFIAHLFYRSGYKIWLVDASAKTVQLLNKFKQYRVDLAGKETDTTEYIEIAGAFTLDDPSKVAEVLRRVKIIATSVGAGNIEQLALFFRDLLMLTDRNDPLNWLICENANEPAKTIRKVLLQGATGRFHDYINTRLGLVETQVLRTGMPAKADIAVNEPLALRMQEWWSLPLDKDAFIGEIPLVEGFSPRAGFANELKRKLYTFNGTNGPIAYIGWANGFVILHEAALAYPEFFKLIQEESAFGLVHEFGLDEDEQRAFMAVAIAKYTDPALADKIERNAVDTKRKLARDERLVGPAVLCLKYGRPPKAYAKAIAAAYFYNGSKDVGTMEVQATIRSSGIETAIRLYSGIDESSPLYHLVVESYLTKSFIMAAEQTPVNLQ